MNSSILKKSSDMPAQFTNLGSPSPVHVEVNSGIISAIAVNELLWSE